MPLSIAEIKDIAAILQAVVTSFGLVVAGVWAYRRYIIEDARYSHIETSAEIDFIGLQGEYWVVEVRAVLENKGKVQHKIEKLAFDLNALRASDEVRTNPEWGGQVDFPRPVAMGSFVPDRFKYFVIGPGIKAKYSYITMVHISTRFVILHCWFDYCDRRKLSHSMEKTVTVPNSDVCAKSVESSPR